MLLARFDNIGGLKARAPVRSAGVTVGRVTSIVLDNQTYQGVVTLAIDSQLQFPRDTSAKIPPPACSATSTSALEPAPTRRCSAPARRSSKPSRRSCFENLIGQFINRSAADAGTPAPAASPKK